MARKKTNSTPVTGTQVKRQQPIRSRYAAPDLAGQYFKANFIFWAVCLIQVVLIRLIVSDFAGTYFFFGFLAIAFTVVSALDFISARLEASPASATEFSER